ncbi:inositol monophosphatase [Frankia sp. AgPm24]|uniref:inositol monophosphatase family protein n=1 Tax=Frankia sp. AgPm24 TaxID=631128 RepID=UPI00200D63BE|nr:inositol monophosphatase family protein [Frankia sp. AgPm24]MCK9921050.1 inositol monophosphatase [Frankia sp. AgPm24]
MGRPPAHAPGGAGPDLQHARAVAVEAAEVAGAMLRERTNGDLEITTKGFVGDLASVLDQEAERIIRGRLRAQFPDHCIRGEELGTSGPASRWEWVVDPLDGTNNVAIGMPTYVVGIALCVDGDPTIGVVHEPLTERTWSALRGGGMHGPRGGQARRARQFPPACPPAATAGREAAGHAVDPGLTVAWTQGHRVGRRNRAARALKYVLDGVALRVLPLWAPLVSWSMIARGDIDGFLGYQAEDIELPAGYLLAVESGVTVLDLEGQPFDARAGAFPRSFVAARPEHLDALMGIVRTAELLAADLPDIRIPDPTR